MRECAHHMYPTIFKDIVLFITAVIDGRWQTFYLDRFHGHSHINPRSVWQVAYWHKTHENQILAVYTAIANRYMVGFLSFGNLSCLHTSFCLQVKTNDKPTSRPLKSSGFFHKDRTL